MLKNKIVILNLNANKNIFASTYQSSTYDVAEVVVKNENSISIPVDIKTKKSVILQAYLIGVKQINNLPRQYGQKKTKRLNLIKNIVVFLGKTKIMRKFLLTIYIWKRILVELHQIIK